MFTVTQEDEHLPPTPLPTCEDIKKEKKKKGKEEQYDLYSSVVGRSPWTLTPSFLSVYRFPGQLKRKSDCECGEKLNVGVLWIDVLDGVGTTRLEQRLDSSSKVGVAD